MTEGQRELGWCRSCGRPVMWIEQPSGKRPPFDVDDQGELVRDATTGKPVSHFATCPQAPAWRGKAKVRADGADPAPRRGEADGTRGMERG